MAETMLRGSKIRIYPNKRQTQIIDLWRRRTTSLWNLLLSFEQAAYSGENIRPELRWRQIWIDLVMANYEKDVQIWTHGWVRKDGSYRRQPGEGVEPVAPTDEQIAKMRPRRTDGEEPKLFIWERDLMALMAALKREPLTQWIADLPSHAAQAVCKDLMRALQAMLRERKKRASGNGGRDTGFPKFKKSRYAAGSVYLANTQFRFDFDAPAVQLPNGVGRVRVEAGSLPRDAKLMGGRLWREGEKWFLSCQWEMVKPEPLPETHRQAGVKIGAKILLTTYDERGQTREFDPPPIDERMQRRHKLDGRKLARCLQGQKEKKRKLAARKKNIHGGKVRLRRSGGFFEASARLAKREAKSRNRRDDYLHKLTTNVVQEFGSIAVQKMNIASLMEKESTKKKRRLARIDDAVERNAAGEGQARQRPMKPVRKMMRQAAMARTQQLLKYKYTDLRSPDAHQEIDPHDVNATACSGCGAIHPEWKEVRGIVRCREVLADGRICGTALPRNRNSARLSKRELDVRLKKKEQV